ncbi:MAG: hypothetical protein JL50_12945 [Peptococcaceae bacterium BICA1-7]|nr:MAG: hypothetical protein JL50_12945 [Peptococcaceae bacterium BICA1-7]HBV97307.1 hypothetical protein [Desulfotomaculum sp.]
MNTVYNIVYNNFAINNIQLIRFIKNIMYKIQNSFCRACYASITYGKSYLPDINIVLRMLEKYNIKILFYLRWERCCE